MKLWHATTEDKARKIAACGVVSPGNPSGWDGTDWRPIKNCVYFSAAPSDCIFHVLYRTFRGNYDKAPPAFGLVCADIPIERLLPDEDDISEHLMSANKLGQEIERLYVSPFKRLSAMLATARRNSFHLSDPDEDWRNDESEYAWDWPNDSGSEIPHRYFQRIARVITPRISNPQLRDELFSAHSKRAVVGEVEVEDVYIVPTFESEDEFVSIETAAKIIKAGTRGRLGHTLSIPRFRRGQKAIAGVGK